jgi:hypothetical protein
VISVLTIGTKSRGFKHNRDEFLRAIKIHSTHSFGWEVKPETLCCKILKHVKIACKYEHKCLQGKIITPFFHSFYFLPDDSAGRTARKLWWTSQFSSASFIISPWFSMITYDLGMNSGFVGGSGSEM